MQRRPYSIEYALEEWQRDHSWTREQLAGWLGITVDALTKMGRDEMSSTTGTFVSASKFGGAPAAAHESRAATLAKRYGANLERLTQILDTADAKRGVTR